MSDDLVANRARGSRRRTAMAEQTGSIRDAREVKAKDQSPVDLGQRRDAFERDTGPLFAAYDGVIRRTLAARSLQEADRDDCVQEVWLNVLATRPSRFQGTDLSAWMKTVAR